ncbi:MAG: 3-phosphoshikimate 1-carboxyvinyltransferase [Deltaproteobacteria bacterium]|nr:3-phosphoshikimate 1-carboxyvinyltransferase [Deltaproteobacteria bacterium]
MIEIKPLHHCDAQVSIPGSKSHTHRAIIISSLAGGESLLLSPLQCEDTEHTIESLRRFGVSIFWEGDTVRVLGSGGRFDGGNREVYVGNSGTSMRFLTALSALRKGRTLLNGNERMRQRPIGELLRGLETLGVKAYSRGEDGYPPVVVESSGLEGGYLKVSGEESSQYLSGLLIISPYASKDVRLEVVGNLVSRSYIDITLSVMAAFGVDVEREGDRSFFVKAGQQYRPQMYRIEGDASSASYFFLAAALTGGKVRVENFNPDSIQGDTAFLDILTRMGCEVLRGERWAEVRGKDLYGIEMDMGGIPDLVPTVAIAAAFAHGKTVLRNINHLRFKESDRIKTPAIELGKMGIRTEEREDSLKIEGGRPHGAEIETYHDHRLAMSFAIAGLVVPGVKIKGEECVNKSFPDFWKMFERLYP